MSSLSPSPQSQPKNMKLNQTLNLPTPQPELRAPSCTFFPRPLRVLPLLVCVPVQCLDLGASTNTVFCFELRYYFLTPTGPELMRSPGRTKSCSDPPSVAFQMPGDTVMLIGPLGQTCSLNPFWSPTTPSDGGVSIL